MLVDKALRGEYKVLHFPSTQVAIPELGSLLVLHENKSSFIIFLFVFKSSQQLSLRGERRCTKT